MNAEQTVQRLIEARDWALANPEKFLMSQWGRVMVADDGNLCGTTQCLAGYGAERLHPVLWKRAVQVAVEDAIWLGQTVGTVAHLGVGLSVRDAGRQWFGITPKEASGLFLSLGVEDAAENRESSWLDVINELIEEYSA